MDVEKLIVLVVMVTGNALAVMVVVKINVPILIALEVGVKSVPDLVKRDVIVITDSAIHVLEEVGIAVMVANVLLVMEQVTIGSVMEKELKTVRNVTLMELVILVMDVAQFNVTAVMDQEAVLAAQVLVK